MQIYLFASDGHPSVSAFTSDKTGGNLPAEYAPWRPVNSGRAMPIGSPSDRIATAIQRDGYFLLSASGHSSAKPKTNYRPDRKAIGSFLLLLAHQAMMLLGLPQRGNAKRSR